MSFVADVVAATIRNATPLALGATGEVVSEKAGVLNLGIEGTMYAGAFFGFLAAHETESPLAGLVVGVGAGVLAGLVLAFFAVTLGVSQHTAGLGLTLALIGLSDFTNRLVLGNELGTATTIDPMAIWHPFGSTGPLAQHGLTYATFGLIVPGVWWMLTRTRLGLAIAAVGENPEAADVAGLSVGRVRYQALMLAGGLQALAGAFITLAVLGTFTIDIIAGRGWVCLALVIFGRWRVPRALVGALLFAGVYALQLRLRILPGWDAIPFELLLALPYLVTILALALAGRSAAYPGAYLQPYRRH